MMRKVISDIRLIIHDIQLLIKRGTCLIKAIISSLTFELKMQHMALYTNHKFHTYQIKFTNP